MKLAHYGQHWNYRQSPSVFSNIAIVSYDFIEHSKNSRPLLTYKAIRAWPHTTTVKVYCADFSHHQKQYVNLENTDFQAIPVPAYRHNISLMRIFSYWVFALKIALKKEIRDCGLIYFCVPANELAIVALFYKLIFQKTVVLDIVDLWPEAFPLPQWINPSIKALFYCTSRPLRNWLFRQSDLIITQSAYFKTKLASPKNSKVVLMGTSHQLDTRFKTSQRQSLQDCIDILYLGSINAINDLDSLIQILTGLKEHRPVHLSVIGGGKRLDYLKEQVESLGISYYFYGICFDHELKNKEFLRCHFGYNGYVPSTEVAISYKSLEYLAHGLPLLNSTKGDTRQLIETQGCGFNFLPSQESRHKLIDQILGLSDQDYYQMQQRSLETFEKNFAWPVFQQTLTETLASLEKQTSR